MIYGSFQRTKKHDIHLSCESNGTVKIPEGLLIGFAYLQGPGISECYYKTKNRGRVKMCLCRARFRNVRGTKTRL